MKKVFILLLLAGTWASFAEDFMGEFTKIKPEIFMNYWIQNKEEWAQPYGSVTLEEGKGVNITSTEKQTMIFWGSLIPARESDLITVIATARGKGKVALGIMAYGASNNWLYTAHKELELEENEMGEYVNSVIFRAAADGTGPSFFRVYITAMENSSLFCEEIECVVENDKDEATK